MTAAPPFEAGTAASSVWCSSFATSVSERRRGELERRDAALERERLLEAERAAGVTEQASQ